MSDAPVKFSFDTEFDEHNPFHHYVPPPQSYIRGLGRWHGHHDWDWSQDPHHFYATYGWKQPWSYAPRTLPYREYRPRVVMQAPVEPSLYRGTPEALMRFARAQTLAGLLKLEREGKATSADRERWQRC